MKKINKEFVLSDNSINPYGFRFVPSGYQLSEFAKNPIGYYKNDRNKGVIVRWSDLAVDNDKVIGKPIINTSNPFAETVIDEIENGFLNCASMGNIVVLDTTYSPFNGSQGSIPTVTKWYNRQCSLFDIPDPIGALGLYDKSDMPINLKSFLLNRDKTIAGLTSSSNNKFHSVNYTVDELLSSARKNNTINIETARQLKEQYQGKPVELKALLETLDSDRTQMLIGLSWLQLDREGLLPELKERSLAAFKAKFKSTFNTDYKS